MYQQASPMDYHAICQEHSWNFSEKELNRYGEQMTIISEQSYFQSLPLATWQRNESFLLESRTELQIHF